MSGAHRFRKHVTRRLGWTPHMIFVAPFSEIEPQRVRDTRLSVKLQDHCLICDEVVDSDGRGQTRGAMQTAILVSPRRTILKPLFRRAPILSRS
jgi:hypothetical protein